MNNTFDINRFGRLMRRQWQEFGKVSWISLGVLVGTLVLLYWLCAPKNMMRFNNDPNLGFRIPVFFGTAFLFISLISSTYFAAYGNKSRAIVELMMPASRIEKFFSGVLFTAILGTACFLVIFYVADWAMIEYISAGLETNPKIPTFLEFSMMEREFTQYLLPVAMLPFLVSSFFLLGSIYFEKYQYIKTLLSGLFIVFFIGWLLSRTLLTLTAGKYRVNTGQTVMSTDDQFYWATLALIGLTAAFWLIGFVRLKEKEV